MASQTKHWELVVYLSMGFGNPYGDEWSTDITAGFMERLLERVDPTVISLADTIGAATPELVRAVFDVASNLVSTEKLGAHLHLHPMEGIDKIKAAHKGGCLRFDGALRGVGGCPMAQDDLIGNAPSEWIVEWAQQQGLWEVNSERALDQALSLAADLFGG